MTIVFLLKRKLKTFEGKKEIEKLYTEKLERAKCLSKFGLSRYLYNDKIRDKCLYWPCLSILEAAWNVYFFSKAGADKIKIWTQEQRVGRAIKQNTDESPVAVDSETNNAFVSALYIEDQLFPLSAKLNLDFLNIVRRPLVTWTNYLHFLLGSFAVAVNAWFFSNMVKV